MGKLVQHEAPDAAHPRAAVHPAEVEHDVVAAGGRLRLAGDAATEVTDADRDEPGDELDETPRLGPRLGHRPAHDVPVAGRDRRVEGQRRGRRQRTILQRVASTVIATTLTDPTGGRSA